MLTSFSFISYLFIFFFKNFVGPYVRRFDGQYGCKRSWHRKFFRCVCFYIKIVIEFQALCLLSNKVDHMFTHFMGNIATQDTRWVNSGMHTHKNYLGNFLSFSNHITDFMEDMDSQKAGGGKSGE